MKKVMAVDEEPRVCVLYEEVLSGLGHEAYTTTNATEAWDLFRKSRPDLVIMDLDMYDGRALETLRRMRSLDRELTIFAVSIHPTAHKASGLDEIAVAEVFSKPVDIGVLRLRLEQALRDHRSDSLLAG